MNGWYSFALISAGLVLLTIGGMIDMVTNYQKHNDALLESMRGFKKNPFRRFRVGFDLSNPKARWWYIAGYTLIVPGFILLLDT